VSIPDIADIVALEACGLPEGSAGMYDGQRNGMLSLKTFMAHYAMKLQSSTEQIWRHMKERGDKKLILVRKPEGKKPLGRRTRRWEESIKK
jgi:hypothetical protein